LFSEHSPLAKIVTKNYFPQVVLAAKIFPVGRAIGKTISRMQKMLSIHTQPVSQQAG
jgi:hypothetical protein